MPHFRVDDQLNNHPKPRNCGLEAMGLWTVSGSYCMAYLTDGFVPEWYVKSWPRGVALAKRLVAARLWESATRDGEKGWQFHEFTGPGRQDSKAEIEAEREKWRIKKAAQRGMSPGDSKGDTPGDSKGESPKGSRFPTQPQPNKDLSSGHLRDDRNVSNARDVVDEPLPPEPDYDPGAEPRDHNGHPPGATKTTTASTHRAPRHPTDAARTLIRQELGQHGYTRTTAERLAVQVDRLLQAGHPDDLVREAVRAWDTRENCDRPEYLATVYDDLNKSRRATPGNNGRPKHKMRSLAELTQEVEAQERAQQALTTDTRKELA